MFRPTRSSRRRFGRALAAVAVLALALPVVGALPSVRPALAQDALDQRRIAGIVGERYDGLLVIRDAGAASAADRAFVDDVNRQRLAVYQQQATAQGTTAGAVAEIYAGEIRGAAPGGTWFLRQSGQWARK